MKKLEVAILSDVAKNVPLYQKRRTGRLFKAKNGLSRHFLETQPNAQAQPNAERNTT